MKVTTKAAAAKRVPRAGRPSTALITRKTAVTAALQLIDEKGLEALSLQSVAQALGVSAPSLYHHFRNKEELLVLIARRLLSEIGRDQAEWSTDWEERMIELSLATRRVMQRHPKAAGLVLRFFPRELTLQAYEDALADCPYPPAAGMIANELIEHATYGASLFAAAAEARQISPMPPFERDAYPNLSRSMEAAPQDPEVRFVEGIRTILAGLRARFG